MLLAQLSDTHVVAADYDGERYVDNNERLAMAVERLNAETVTPDVVVATGDLVDTGTESEMDALADLLDPLEIPLLPLVGNHDRKDTFARHFDMPWASETNLSWTVDVGPFRILGLDTMVNQPGRAELSMADIEHGGVFDDERSAWLAEQLANAGTKPVVIAMHHPPFAAGIHWMDKNGLDGNDRFAAMVAGSDANIVRILCGHLHRSITTTVGGVVTSTAVSTVQHVELDFDDNAPVRLVLDDPGYHLHRFEPDTYSVGGFRCVSHVRHFDTGHQPIDPSWADDHSAAD